MLCPGAGRGLGHPTAPQHPPGAWGGHPSASIPPSTWSWGGPEVPLPPSLHQSVHPSLCPFIPPSPCPYFPLGTGVFPTPTCYRAVPPQPSTARALCQLFSPPHHPSGCSEVYVSPPTLAQPGHAQLWGQQWGEGWGRGGRLLPCAHPHTKVPAAVLGSTDPFCPHPGFALDPGPPPAALRSPPSGWSGSCCLSTQERLEALASRLVIYANGLCN